MDAKLRNILELALDPRTGEGESVAALNAARRLAQRVGVHSLLADSHKNMPPKSPQMSLLIRMTVPAKYVHSMMEHVFQEAAKLNVDVDLVKFYVTDGHVLNHSHIHIRATGDRNQVDVYYKLLEILVAATNADQPQVPTKEKGWFARMFQND